MYGKSRMAYYVVHIYNNEKTKNTFIVDEVQHMALSGKVSQTRFQVLG